MRNAISHSHVPRVHRLWIAVLLGILLVSSLHAQESLPRSTPEEQGVASSAVLDFITALDSKLDAMNSVMILRHGQVIAEGWWTPYHAGARHELYSLSKSFTSTAVGLAIAEGRLSLDDEVTKFFPDELPGDVGSNLRAMRVRDLLCMSTGHQQEPSLASSDQAWTKSFLAQPVPFKPGTHFLYNTPATYMQSAIVQKVTGQTVRDYLMPRLFDPLGIVEPTWGTSPQGISLGGYGLNLRTEDIAKFGQLYLQKGKWRDRQLVPADWIDLATSRQVSNGSNPRSDWEQGYGFQFWRCRHNAYRGDGAFGQYCVVMPDYDAVLVITSGLQDMQAVLDLAWDRLLPGLMANPLSANPTAHRALKKKLEGLQIAPPTGSHLSTLTAQISGHRYELPTNDLELQQIGIRTDNEGRSLTLQFKHRGREQEVACGFHEWLPGRMVAYNGVEQPIASRAAWSADDTLDVKLCFYETPFYLTWRMKFVGNQIEFTSSRNVGFGERSP